MKKRFVIGIGIAAMTLAASASFGSLLFSLDHNALNSLADGERITSWSGNGAFDTFNNGGPALGPTVEVINGQKWERNTQCTYKDGPPPTAIRKDGFAIGSTYVAGGDPSGGFYYNPIPLAGATIITAIRPIRNTTTNADNWTSVVDIFGQLTLGVNNNTGQVNVRRIKSNDLVGQWWNWDKSTITLDSNVAVILSMTVNVDGSYEVWANGNSIMTGGATTFTQLVRTNNLGVYYGSKRMYIGRGDVAGDNTFNGNIGDVKVWTNALTNDQRLAEVSAMTTAMGMSAPVPEPGSMVAMFSGLIGLAGFATRKRK